MKASKIFILPSIREGFGLVLVKANAASLPVITMNHDNNAAKDLILEGVNGLLAEPSEQSIAEKINQILQTYSMLESKRGIEKYDWQIVAQSIRQVLV